MKEKRKAKKEHEEWCPRQRVNIPWFRERRSLSDEPVLTLKMKFRCPTCGKRMNVILIGCQCCYPQVFFTEISAHKRKNGGAKCKS